MLSREEVGQVAISFPPESLFEKYCDKKNAVYHLNHS